jgi:hypothetical protein
MDLHVTLVNHVYGPFLLAMMLVDYFLMCILIGLFCDWEIRLRYRGDSAKTSRRE